MKKSNAISKKDKSSKKREVTNINETNTRRSKPSEEELREDDWHEAELYLSESEF
jgi:hypothetical protein